MNLTDLQILALDCQSTGASSAKGHLLEMGWVKTCAAATQAPEDLPVRSYLVELQKGVDIPRAVQRVTGIGNEALEKAVAPGDIWQKVVTAATEIAAADHMHDCPTIIHYARFEKPFLKNLHAENNRQAAFPFLIICTHEIARRLLPGLPRRGLRALAGYFGHSVPAHRRSAGHAVATALIWKNLVEKLNAEHGIQNLAQLTDWLKHTIPETRTGRTYPMPRAIRLSLPEKPGIYRMRRSNGDLLYIGKATSLKHRVNSYFRQRGPQAERTLEMLSQAADLDVTLTGSALEAAVLESDEIKRHSPPYNVALQKGQRQLVFFSKDLQNCTVKPDKIHRIGPLPEGKITEAIAAFGRWHAHSQDPPDDDFHRIGSAILAVPDAFAPQPDCLAAGLALFRQQHLRRLRHPSPLRALSGLGRELWRKRLEELKNAPSGNEAETDVQDLEPEQTPLWTPERVGRAIERFSMYSALLIRRSRWLCLLSESSLAWEARDSEGCRKIVLLFDKGAIGQRQELAIEKELPLSAGYVKSIFNRQKIFDFVTYERLRVVSTELRRLITEKRIAEIRLNPKVTLRAKQLANVLPWV
jgi:DNA polymerase-3 subunit epsilon